MIQMVSKCPLEHYRGCRLNLDQNGVNQFMESGLSRCCTASGSSTGFSQFSPSKVLACKSSLFTECSLVIKISNTWLIFVVTLYS